MIALTEWGDRWIVTYHGPVIPDPAGGKWRPGDRLGTIALWSSPTDPHPVWRLYNHRHAIVGFTPTPASPEDAANHLRIIVTGADQ